jgi:uncharacterized PurR-regulated membrane protein YhhQ (DUF165 family)
MKYIVFISFLFLLAFIAANLIVKHFGAYGLLFSSFLLIPFDFVCRCIIHERLKGMMLIYTLFILTVLAAIWTVIINSHAINIAAASVCGFVGAQIGAGIFYQYQLHKESKSWFYKVNISDLIAIVFDSIIFQIVAFYSFDIMVTVGQIIIKFLGGLLWYFIIFKKLKLHERVIRANTSY